MRKSSKENRHRPFQKGPMSIPWVLLQSVYDVCALCAKGLWLHRPFVTRVYQCVGPLIKEPTELWVLCAKGPCVQREPTSLHRPFVHKGPYNCTSPWVLCSQAPMANFSMGPFTQGPMDMLYGNFADTSSLNDISLLMTDQKCHFTDC